MFKLESIEDRMQSVGRNPRVRKSEMLEAAKEPESESQFGTANEAEDELMARLRSIEAEALAE